jgi:hypothetical protein
MTETWTPHGPAIAVYPYVDESGVVLFEVCRTADKQFPQRRPDPTAKSGYTWNLDGVRRVPYRLPQLLKGVATGRGICAVEGERDVLSLEALGLVATTNPGGAGKWRSEFSPHFKGATVYILPDNDVVGRKHAEQVAQMLFGVAKEIRVVPLPGLKEHGDVSDWLASGGTPDALKKLVHETPKWEPAPEPDARPQPTGAPILRKRRAPTTRRDPLPIEAAKAVPIDVVVERLGLLILRRGRVVRTHCPFHDDHRPSLDLDLRKGVWFCQVCQVGGDGIELVMRKKGLSFADAVREVAA